MTMRWRLTLIDRYLWRSIMVTHGIFSSLFILVVILSNIWYFAPEWLRLGLKLTNIFLMILFFIPGALLQATAVALAMALMVVVTRTQFYHEIDAMRSLGASMLRVFRPILLYSVFIFSLLLITSFVVYPWSMNSFKQYYAKVLSQQVGIRMNTAEPKQLGSLTLYLHDEGKIWLISEERNGYRLLLWAKNGEIDEKDGLRFMNSDNASLFLIESNLSGRQWHWAEMSNLTYPLTFDMQAISYNPYDDLFLKDLMREYRKLYSERTQYKSLQKERLAEIKKLLTNARLNDNEIQLYEQEINSITNDSGRFSELISAQFVIYLRLSHSLLALVLILLTYAMFMHYRLHIAWSIFAVVITALISYWVIFYSISRRILQLEIPSELLFLPIILLTIASIVLWIKELFRHSRSN